MSKKKKVLKIDTVKIIKDSDKLHERWISEGLEPIRAETHVFESGHAKELCQACGEFEEDHKTSP